jgi:hypothetical protein
MAAEATENALGSGVYFRISASDGTSSGRLVVLKDDHPATACRGCGWKAAGPRSDGASGELARFIQAVDRY